MLESFGYMLSLFGGISLLMTLITNIFLKKEVTNPNCPEDVKHVENNKKWSRGFMIVSSVMFGIGLILLLCALYKLPY